MVGAEGDNRLHGFKGDAGEPPFPADARPAMMGIVISKPSSPAGIVATALWTFAGDLLVLDRDNLVDSHP
jgi:hypothetical protein